MYVEKLDNALFGSSLTAVPAVGLIIGFIFGVVRS
jgi:hypothetical protein